MARPVRPTILNPFSDMFDPIDHLGNISPETPVNGPEQDSLPDFDMPSKEMMAQAEAVFEQMRVPLVFKGAFGGKSKSDEDPMEQVSYQDVVRFDIESGLGIMSHLECQILADIVLYLIDELSENEKLEMDAALDGDDPDLISYFDRFITALNSFSMPIRGWNAADQIFDVMLSTPKYKGLVQETIELILIRNMNGEISLKDETQKVLKDFLSSMR